MDEKYYAEVDITVANTLNVFFVNDVIGLMSGPAPSKRQRRCSSPGQPKIHPHTCLCKPGISIGHDRLQRVLQLLEQLNEKPDAEILLIDSPHQDAKVILESLPDSKVRRNVQLATNMPESVNPFVECEHDQVICIEEARRWFQWLGFTA